MCTPSSVTPCFRCLRIEREREGGVRGERWRKKGEEEERKVGKKGRREGGRKEGGRGEKGGRKEGGREEGGREGEGRREEGRREGERREEGRETGEGRREGGRDGTHLTERVSSTSSQP